MQTFPHLVRRLRLVSRFLRIFRLWGGFFVFFCPFYLDTVRVLVPVPGRNLQSRREIHSPSENSVPVKTFTVLVRLFSLPVRNFTLNEKFTVQ